MGQEILYCAKCQNRLRSVDFEKGQGLHLEGRAFCKSCAEDVLRSYPPEKREQLLRQAKAPKSTERTTGSQTERNLRAPIGLPPASPASGQESGSRIFVMVGLGVVALAIGVAVFMSAGGSSPPHSGKVALEPGQFNRDSSVRPIEGGKPRAEEPREPGVQALSFEKREEIAKELLRKARGYAASNPSDFAGQHSRFEEAAWSARETSLQETARAELKAVEKRELDSFAVELTGLDAQTQPILNGEEFSKAIGVLEEAKKRHAGGVWSGALDRRVAQASETAAKLYASVKEKALEVGKQGGEAELNALRERVKKWGLPVWTSELEKTLADAKAPEPPKPAAPQAKLPEPSVKPPSASPKPALPAVPDAARLREAEAALRKGTNLDQAKSPKEKGDLARTLLSKAESSEAKDAELYVLLRQARTQAALGGDVKTALEAISKISAAFDIDLTAERIDLFGKATVKGPDAAAWTRAAMDAAEEAVDADDYEAAVKLAARAEALAAAAKDKTLQETTKERSREIGDMRRASESLKATFKSLEANPEDPAANVAVGKFLCLFKGDWKRGLGLLAKGLDPSLKSIAEQEMGTPSDANAQAALAEAWLTQAEKETASYRSRARFRAADWLKRAVPGLTGSTKLAAERKLAALGPLAGSRDRMIVDLGGAKMEFVAIKAGTFTMGSSVAPEFGWQADERPEHKVTITKSFSLGKYPVTRGQFVAFVKATGYKTEAERAGWAFGWNEKGDIFAVPGLNWQNAPFLQADDHPVLCINWNDAKAFCDWAAKLTGRVVRLPTEAEWEYACRAGTRTKWFFGDDESAFGEYAWCRKNSGLQTHPVGQKKPNPWGLFDMHGSAWQWCQDLAGAYGSDAVDPTGAASSDTRVLRGGAWSDDPVRSSLRIHTLPTRTQIVYGFRVAMN